ncbi:MAG TPA: hypothetical protein VKU40_10695 [Thermoanaerobaculia bacterium]|nr:hypothetical protein [Thermoanaerobaculia bacterium]
MPPAVRARAWCRVDLAGGTLDIWPLGILHPGAATVNLAIDVAVEVTVETSEDNDFVVVPDDSSAVRAETASRLAQHPDGALVGTVLHALRVPPVRVTLASDSPRGGGLGASSAMAVALVAAVEEHLGRPASSPEQRVALARDLEAQLMELPTGVQDHWPGLLGGALVLRHGAGGTTVEQPEVDLEALGRCLVVAYTGVSHFSAGQNWQVVRRRLDGEEEAYKLFAGIAGVASRAAEALAEGDLERLGRLVGDEWLLRRRLADGVSVPAIDQLLTAARGAGAWGGKACGAGGGGCVAVLCPPERRDEVAAAVEAAGGRLLAATPAAGPLLVERF